MMMAGAMLGAASRRKTVLVDGYICSAAALAAVGLNPELSNFLVFSHQSAERGHRHTLELLGATALLNLELRLGEGTGAVLAWPIVKASADMLSKMATFEKAEVTRMLRS